MNAALRILDVFISVLTGAAAVALVVLTLVIFTDALFREIGYPFQGTRDLTGLGLALITLLGIPYAGRTNGHIVVDLLPEFRSRFLNNTREVLIRLVAIGIFGALTNQALVRADETALFDERSNILGISYEPFYYVMMVAAGIYTLVLVAEAILLAAGRPIPRFRGSAVPHDGPESI